MSQTDETVADSLLLRDENCKKASRPTRFLTGTNFQFMAALIGSFSTCIVGMGGGWTSQITEELLNGDMGFPITKDQMGWIGSLLPLGSVSTSLIGGIICNYFGEKRTLLFLIIPNTIGWCVMIWADGVTMLYIGRFLIGAASGPYAVVSVVYISNIAEKDLKSRYASLTTLMVNIGLLYSSVLGILFSIKTFTICCTVLNLIFGILLILVPETPSHLIQKGEIEKARSVLARLRKDSFDVNSELTAIEKNWSMKESFFTFTTFKHPQIQRACIVCFGILIFKKISGVDAIIEYSSYIFHSAQLNLSAKIQTIIINVIATISGLFQTYIVKRVGYRFLLCICIFVNFVSLLVAGLVLSLKDKNLISPDYYIYVDYLPLIAFIAFFIAFNFGLGPVAWILLGNLFPQKYKSSAASVGLSLMWSLNFVVTKVFFVMDSSLGADVTFFIFAICTFIGFIFALFLVPDIKKNEKC